MSANNEESIGNANDNDNHIEVEAKEMQVLGSMVSIGRAIERQNAELKLVKGNLLNLNSSLYSNSHSYQKTTRKQNIYKSSSNSTKLVFWRSWALIEICC